MTVEVAASAAVTPAIARAFIEQARQKNYQHGVIGVRARPEATTEFVFEFGGQSVRIVAARSSLALREAIRTADADGWLVVVTDRSDDDLGAGLLSHLIWQRLRHPDPWQAVQQAFAAHSVDGRLLSVDNARDVASGLLELAPTDGWPPAPAGVLTREHALSSAARAELGLPAGPVDLIAVLHWSTDASLPAAIARLRSRAGESTVDAILDWVADSSGEAAPFVAALLRTGTVTGLVPLGVAVDCLLNARDRHEAELALARLQHRWGSVPRGALAAAGRLSRVVLSGLLGASATFRTGAALLAQADDLLSAAQAQHLTGDSTLLRSGLTHRLRTLAKALRLGAGGDLSALEQAWARVADHELVDGDARVASARAGVRLVRWLAATAGDEAPMALAALVERHLLVDAWVDSAVNDAETGVDDPGLASALEAVLRAVEERRDAHDLEFAAALAREGCDDSLTGVRGLERLLPDIVAPLAKDYPTLLLVLDGMSAGVATELLEHATTEVEFGMMECLIPGVSRRTPALSVLPSVTEMSRSSLLAGRLTRGQQDAERRNFAAFTSAKGLGEAPLFHKKGLDTGRQGFAIADDVRLAIADTARYKLVGCVLNTIDDALDRTDPGGTDWTAETVKHLGPLLRAARAAGRLVVLTSDHGHVVERRRGQQRGTGLGGRYRSTSTPAAPDEVLVSGPRVLADGHEAVLAVNERLRYGPLKAGYHGGAAPAEVVVPVAILAPSTLSHSLAAAPVAEPSWWDLTGAPALLVEASSAVAEMPDEPQPVLFSSVQEPGVRAGAGRALVESTTYRAQKKLVGRVAVTDDAIATLIEALASTSDRRLSANRVATLLGVPSNRVAMVMSQVSKVLNVEGYPVIATDPTTQAVTLDVDLLAEQYGVRS
ncbi:BREX-2 system phosphatase PglZ [Tessaracoccus oleiagri]|uniref:PglZ domain-containing protein n=1 Tax=Tessaracoccus oleiagri TaxID=686624 RepID=A0A1G9K202_9ACTN|nr:BREX-2 system phosphatase PglZ [Tessaracoccus oleiagri]SDL43712.1 PglZ domain-containing protein [Tessaracoccus oleiagri]